ncbi:MAG: PAS domain S-box protein [Pseudomonadota bacterium]
MNIDLRNRTIFTKILSGFILLLLLASLMGGVLYYGLKDVTGVLRRITERNAPSIRYPTRVQRYALRAILDEKMYLLLQKKEIHEQAMQDIQEIYANLDRVDQVATEHNDQVLLRKSRDVRRAIEEYQGYYNQGVVLLEENGALELRMRVLGTKVNDLSHTQTLAHKRLLEEAVAKGIDQSKYMEGFRLCTEIEKEALEARRQEKNYILYKKQEYFDGLKEHIANLNKLYDEIAKIAYVFEHEPLIAETRKITGEYLAAAEKWMASDNELSEILTEMHEIGVKVRQAAMAVQEAGWHEMDRSKERAQQITKKASLTGILVAGFTIIIGIVLAFFIARGIARPIKGLSLATIGIAGGDLGRRVAVKGRDEVGQLAIAFNTMVEKLQNTMVSRDYFDNIIRSMIDLLIVADAEAKIETVNQATCDVSGYTEEELIGQPVSIIFAEEEEEEEALFKGSGLSRLMREGEVRNMELTILSKSGERIPLVFNGSVIRGEDGTLATVVGVARDMREMMRLIAELRESEEALRRFSQDLELKVEERTKELRNERDYTRHLIDSSPDFQMTLDREGIIRDLNQAFEEFAGKSRKELIGSSVYQYLPMEEAKKAIFEIFEKKKVRNIEIRAKMPGQGNLTLNFSGTLFTTPEGDPEIYVTSRDITKEIQSAHSARLATLGEMATAMAHEINQPLSVISMVAEGISRDMEKDRMDISLLPNDTEDLLRNVKRIDRIITHMRTFARQPGECELLEPEEVLNNAFIILGEQFKMHDIAVSCHIQENLPHFEVEPNQLEQVTINLLINARQVLDQKGEEAKRAGKSFQKELMCSIFRQGDDIVFEFADNGYGVPDGNKSRIFDPFYTTKEPGQGTGLGLSIAYNIITQSFNGRIWVEDNEMGGASFLVAVPIKRAKGNGSYSSTNVDRILERRIGKNEDNDHRQ